MADDLSRHEVGPAAVDAAAAGIAAIGGYSRAGSCPASSSGLYIESDSASEDDGAVEEFAADEQELEDVTAKQHQEGRDLQGIPWDRLQVGRDRYRQQRLDQYRNYMNCIQEEEWASVRRQLIANWPQPTPYTTAACPYDFVRNWRAVSSSIVHFQLRNLLWASSAHDVYVVYDNRVQHWNAVIRGVEDVLDLRGAPKGPRLPGLGRVQVSTLCVCDELLAAGGFSGELILGKLTRREADVHWEEADESGADSDVEGSEQTLQSVSDTTTSSSSHGGQQQWLPLRQAAVSGGSPVAAAARQTWQQQRQQWVHGPGLQQPRQHHSECCQLQAFQGRQLGAAGPAAAEVMHCCRVTQNENGITNGIEVFQSCGFGHCVMTSNNDCCVRLFDVEGCRPRQRVAFPFAINYSTVRPEGASLGGGPVAAVVGDDPVTWLVDCRSGIEVMKLKGHRDFSFAAAWHPAGHLLATGNQDSTTRVWDVRQSSAPLALLAGSMGAIRSLRFSPDGRFLAAAEPADFVHIYDVASEFNTVQDIDLFGEVAGISFSPDAQAVFVAVSDTLYSSLMQYQRAYVEDADQT